MIGYLILDKATSKSLGKKYLEISNIEKVVKLKPLCGWTMDIIGFDRMIVEKVYYQDGVMTIFLKPESKKEVSYYELK